MEIMGLIWNYGDASMSLLFIKLSRYRYMYASALTWFIIYIYYWNLQFLNNVSINKTKVLLPQALVTLADFAYPV
jgi:hypothetical protein